MPLELSQADVDRINEALFAGRFIEAIKIYRAATGTGLKEAKDFAEELEARLRAEVPGKFTAPPRTTTQVSLAGCAVLVLTAAAAVGALVWLLR